MAEPRRLPPEKQADCDCDAGLQLPLLIESTGTYESLTACVGCGKLDYTACLMQEPRPDDLVCVGNEVLAIDPSLRKWLEQWPRRAGRRRMSESKFTFFPATLRCGNSKAMADLAERAYVEQEEMSRS